MTKKQNPSPLPTMLAKPKEEVTRILQSQIVKGHGIQEMVINDGSALENAQLVRRKWSSSNEGHLDRCFNTRAKLEEYKRHAAVGSFLIGDGGPTFPEEVQDFRDLVREKVTRLEVILADAEEMDEAADARQVCEARMQRPVRRKVFVVHGHDLGAKDTVARFLEAKLGLEAVVLQEKPYGGRTTIEKFEEYAEVDYAVVVLTPDDLGGLQGHESQQARARQNVVFELGFFAGKLGRGKVCLLAKGDLELPSDLYGVGYVQMDANYGWKIKLVEEMLEANIPIDRAKLIGG